MCRENTHKHHIDAQPISHAYLRTKDSLHENHFWQYDNVISYSSVRSYQTLGNSLHGDDTTDRISGCHVLNKLSNKSSRPIDGLIISSFRSDCGGSRISSKFSCIMTF